MTRRGDSPCQTNFQIHSISNLIWASVSRKKRARVRTRQIFIKRSASLSRRVDSEGRVHRTVRIELRPEWLIYGCQALADVFISDRLRRVHFLKDGPNDVTNHVLRSSLFHLKYYLNTSHSYQLSIFFVSCMTDRKHKDWVPFSSNEILWVETQDGKRGESRAWDSDEDSICWGQTGTALSSRQFRGLAFPEIWNLAGGGTAGVSRSE